MSRQFLLLLTVLLPACGVASVEQTPLPGPTEAHATAEPASADDVTDDAAGDVAGDVTKPTVTFPPEAIPTPAPTAPPRTPTPAPTTMTDLSAAVPMASTLPAYTTFTRITDNTGRITLEVPAEWSDVNGAPLEVNGVTVSDIRASTDLAELASTWTTPGVIVSAGDLPGITPESILDEERSSLSVPCTFVAREPYTDPLYTGQFDTYDACGGTDAAYVVIAARAHDGTGPLIEVQVQVSDARDVVALEQIVASFIVA